MMGIVIRLSRLRSKNLRKLSSSIIRSIFSKLIGVKILHKMCFHSKINILRLNGSRIIHKSYGRPLIPRFYSLLAMLSKISKIKAFIITLKIFVISC